MGILFLSDNNYAQHLGVAIYSLFSNNKWARCTVGHTLVVGYSVKARGIAKDLFGTFDNYVFPVQSIKNESDLKERFEWLKGTIA